MVVYLSGILAPIRGKFYVAYGVFTAHTSLGEVNGDQDGLRAGAIKLHDILDTYGIGNSFEIYSGTHTSAVADRVQNHVMPFFSKNLCFTARCP